MIIDIDEKKFKSQIEEGLKVVIFSAKWCSYCQKQHEVLREIKDIIFLNVDGDKNANLVREYGVMGFPTFVIFKNGVEVSKFSGYKNKFELMNILVKYI